MIKTALVHDWLTGMRGGEKVLEALCGLFPDAAIHTLIYRKNTLSAAIENMPIKTGFLNKFPGAERNYRYYLPVMPLAISCFDMSEYDLIISVSHCVAKGIKKKRKEQIHICYCNTPMRYIWDSFGDYFSPRRNFALWSAMLLLRPYLQYWDKKTSQEKNVDFFIANSKNVAARIKKFWDRYSEVIYPPVDTDFYTIPEDKTSAEEDFYLIVSALVPYKRIDLALKAFNKLNNKKLKIIGTGPEENYLRKLAGKNTEFLGWQDASTIREHYRHCKALIFPGEEDFGIVPVEVQSSGRPVIAYAKGGALETVIEGKTGIFFRHQTEESLLEAVEIFEKMNFDPQTISFHAEKFSKSNFITNIKSFLEKCGYKKSGVI